MLLLALLACAPDCPKDGCAPADSGGADSGDSGGGDSGADSGGGDSGADSGGGDSGGGPTCAVLDVSAVSPGPPVNNARVTATLDATAAGTVSCALVAGPGEREAVFGPGADWRYFDGPAVGAGWELVGFDDSAWEVGPAPLGYGEDGVATTISYGFDASAKRITSWFRATVTVEDPSTLRSPRVELDYDDGAVVYVNGVEVGRANLPEGALAADTAALTSVEPTAVAFPLDSGVLVAGENVVAVELHQQSGTTSDAWMDLALTVGGEPTTDPEEVVEVRVEPSNPQVYAVHGLLAESTYRCTVTPDCAEPAAVEITTGSLPADLPSLTAEGAMPHDGYVVFPRNQSCLGESQLWLVMIDPDGRVRWYAEAKGVVQSNATDIEVAWLGDGLILYGGGEAAVPRILDLDGAEAYVTTYPGIESETYHHDVQWTDRGTIIGLVLGSVETGVGPVVTGFRLVEHDPLAGAVVWEWNAQDAYDAGELAYGGGYDPWHANALADVTDAAGDAVYVSLYTAGEIIRIDKATGAITATLGRGGDWDVYAADGSAGDAGDWFEATHGLDVYGGDELVVYDNAPSAAESRVVVYEVDPLAGDATLTYEWADGWAIPNWGDADRMPDGNLLVTESGTWCTGGTSAPGSFLVVDPATDAVEWRATFSSRDDAAYRGQWIDACEVFGNLKYCP